MRRGAARFDASAWRELMADGKCEAHLAIVVADEGTGLHFEIDGEPLVEVQLMPDERRLTARLGDTGGVWRIPPIGAEVVVVVADGELAAGAVIVARLDNAPDGLAVDTIVVLAPAGGKVLIHDGTAAQAVALATKADVQAVRDALNNHAHTYVPGTGAATLTTFNPTVPAPAGTSVLKAR